MRMILNHSSGTRRRGFGSLGAMRSRIPWREAGLAAALLVLRTALEDRTLHEELPGYPQYAAQVRYLLLPGVW